jgi:hypothetical protein
LLGRGGVYGNVLRIKPPMCITRADVDFLADFARFQVCFSGPNDAPTYSEPSWQCVQTFDQDCDGDVDSFDFRVFFVGFDGP